LSAPPRSTDVFVIGGGPAGLAAAIAARRRGFDVTVADCSVPPIDKACGEGIMPDGLAAARALGIDLDNCGAQPFRGIRLCAGDSVEASFPVSGLGLRRTALHAVLMDYAAEAGVRMLWGTRVTGLGTGADDRFLPSAAWVALARYGEVRARWIIGADGGQSPVRRWAGLDACRRDTRRFGFRRHYRVAPWSEFMEIHWADRCQLYVTPVGPDEICLVVISHDPHFRLDEALPRFPEVARRLGGVPPATIERGGVSASRRLRSVWRGRVALVGDASGSVDAITGEGLCLVFQQSKALADALAAGDLSLYQAEHRRIGRRPEMMADFMLLLENGRLRRRAMRAMAADPRLFARLLAVHVGERPARGLFTNGLSLGWRMLTV
jgi:flavin-dependent dehydrogenase